MLLKIVCGKEIHIMNNKEAITLAELQQFVKTVFKKLPPKYIFDYIDLEGDRISLSSEGDMGILHQSGLSKVKIEIEETSQQFYDLTQQVLIEDQEKSSQADIIQDNVETNIRKQKLDIIDLDASQISSIDNLNQSIEEKMKLMLPDMIKKIKEQVLEESRISEVKALKPQKIEEPIIHEHIICDQCQQNGIVGARYKCVVCADFDLCQKCEAKTSHDHPFLKIKKPSQAPYKIIAMIKDDRDSLQVNGRKMDIPSFQEGLTLLSDFFKNTTEHLKSQSSQFFNEEKKQQWKQMKNEWKKKTCQMWQEITGKNGLPKEEIKKEVVPGDEVEQKVYEPKKEIRVGEQEKKEVLKPKRSIVEEEIITEKALYLSEILGKQIPVCLHFVEQNKKLSHEELVELYFQKPF